MTAEKTRYILEIYAHGSISKAAKELNISQQGLSKALKEIEMELGQPLFSRSAAGAAPTEFCRFLLHDLQALADAQSRLRESVRQYAKEQNERISVACGNLRPHMYALNAVRDYCARKQLRLDLLQYYGSHLDAENRTADIIIDGQVHDPNYERYPLCYLNYHFITRREDAASYPEGANHSCLLEKTILISKNDRNTPEMRLIRPIFSNSGVEPHVVACMDDDFLYDILRRTKDAVACIPGFRCKTLMDEYDGLAMLPDSLYFSSQLSMYFRKDKARKRVFQELRECIYQTLTPEYPASNTYPEI